MAKYEYSVSRVGGTFAYEAVESGSGHRIALKTNFDGESYPDLEAHLASHHGIQLQHPLVLDQEIGDILDREAGTYTFVRDPHEIIVHDVPRVMAEITSDNPPGIA